MTKSTAEKENAPAATEASLETTLNHQYISYPSFGQLFWEAV